MITPVEIKLYVVILFASLISCFVGFSLETVRARITLVQKKKRANVKAVMFPTLPMVPLGYLAVCFGINLILDNLGFIIVGLYFGLETSMKLIRLLKFKKQYDLMKPKLKKALKT